MAKAEDLERAAPVGVIRLLMASVPLSIQRSCHSHSLHILERIARPHKTWSNEFGGGCHSEAHDRRSLDSATIVRHHYIDNHVCLRQLGGNNHPVSEFRTSMGLFGLHLLTPSLAKLTIPGCRISRLLLSSPCTSSFLHNKPLAARHSRFPPSHWCAHVGPAA